ncbi:hypothetical protein S010_005011 [Salmonella enterica subsp. enterica serovar Oranienburg]|nr:hypothetical protein [Salmonella enterica subsp. enterica serovar Oranienburg]EDV4590575.1 hypothetical protein [Salmonella enterica subsp. enterica]EED3979916.1 hypothetical protein [Salmonella enterica subsp. enterica serovar Mbandaka]EDV5330108.1 hypothetical protein [Salmonella enterica subsp. enterica serovar Oranienburg]EED3918841.1 hypothetical protein [Salmonella enterica subsp. enterica]
MSVLWLEWNCLQPTSKNNRYDRQCKSKYRDLRHISGQPLYGHFCAVCNTRRIYTFPH